MNMLLFPSTTVVTVHAPVPHPMKDHKLGARPLTRVVIAALPSMRSAEKHPRCTIAPSGGLFLIQSVREEVGGEARADGSEDDSGMPKVSTAATDVCAGVCVAARPEDTRVI